MTVTFESTTLASPPVNTAVASDTIGGIDYQRIKVVWGTTGTANELTTGAGLPVQITALSSALNVTTTPSSQMTVTTTPSSQMTVTTIPSSQTTVTVGSISSSTGIIGSITTIPSSQATVTAVLSSGNLVIGSVAASTQWTVTTVPTSSTLVLGSVSPSSQWTVTTVPTSSTLVLGSVAASTQWTVALSSGTQVIGSVAASTQWTVTTVPTSSTLALGTVTLSSGTLALGTVTLSSGSLALGSVGVSSGTVTLTSGALPLGSVTLTSGTLALGKIGSQADFGAVYNSVTGLSITPTIASLACSSSGLNAIVTAPSSGRVIVLSMYLVAAGAVSLQLCSSTTAGTFGGVTSLSSNAGYVLPFNPVGWIATTTSSATSGTSSVAGLYANLLSPVQVGGNITYIVGV